MAEIVSFPCHAPAGESHLPKPAEHLIEAREALRGFLSARGNTKKLLRANKRLYPAMRKFRQLRISDDADAAAMVRWCLEYVIIPQVEREGLATHHGYLGELLTEVAEYLEHNKAPEPPEPRFA